MAKNVEMSVKENKLTIVVDLTKDFGESSTGKSVIVASSEGNADVPGGGGVKIGLNVFRVKPKGK